jgi:uncharacterized protein (TIGR02598 family)
MTRNPGADPEARKHAGFRRWGVLFDLRKDAPERCAAPCGAWPPAHKLAGAFSLVEVTLALGLVGFAVLAVIGLLPGGLSTLRQSMEQTVEAQIVQSIAAQSVITPFKQMSTNDQYFDDEGLPSTAAEARYTAKVTFPPSTYPGSSISADIESSLATVRIQLVSRQESRFYTLKVANSGK